MQSIRGTVTGIVNGFFVVECPEAPAHLRVLNLRRWQTWDAQVGDDVELTYQTDHRSGLWNVTAVSRQGRVIKR